MFSGPASSGAMHSEHQTASHAGSMESRLHRPHPSAPKSGGGHGAAGLRHAGGVSSSARTVNPKMGAGRGAGGF
jgi:hypothetical protein